MTPIDHFQRGEFAILLGTCEKSPPDRKNTKFEIVTFPLVLDTFTSPFTIPRSNWKANLERIEGRMLWLQKSSYALIIGEANDHFFEGESPF